jgi:ElaA protein
MRIRWSTKRFDELTVHELHDLLRLRVDIFVVEQRCAYPEIDGRDPHCIHLLGYDEAGTLLAGTRIVPPEADGLPHIGRVVVRHDVRGHGLATTLMQRALDALAAHYGSRRSALAAQSQLEGFYERFGYRRTGDDYPWDGILHVDMRRDSD